jgi:hypothetical protein
MAPRHFTPASARSGARAALEGKTDSRGDLPTSIGTPPPDQIEGAEDLSDHRWRRSHDDARLDGRA